MMSHCNDVPDIWTQSFWHKCSGHDGNWHAQAEFPAQTGQAAQPDSAACSGEGGDCLDMGSRLYNEIEHVVVQRRDLVISHGLLCVCVQAEDGNDDDEEGEEHDEASRKVRFHSIG